MVIRLPPLPKRSRFVTGHSLIGLSNSNASGHNSPTRQLVGFLELILNGLEKKIEDFGKKSSRFPLAKPTSPPNGT